MEYGVIELGDGESLYIVLNNSKSMESGPAKASLTDTIKKLSIDFSNEMSKVAKFICNLRKGIVESVGNDCPKKIEIEFGLDISQTLGCVIVDSEVSSQISVKLIWE